MGVVRFWNPAAELVSGRDGEGVLGRPASEIFDGWEAIAAEIPISDDGAVASPVTLPVDVDGRELWLSFVAVRSYTGVVYAFRDLTVERRLDEAKSDFIATVSHELRTPMTAVLGAAKTLLRDDIVLSPERRRQLLEMIGAQGTRLTHITEEVLLASRLDRGDLRFDSESVDVAELVRGAVETMREQLPESISLSAAVERNGAMVVGDPDRIEQVLVNLIDNAIKYSPYGGAVAVSTEPCETGVRVQVEDEGIGIPVSEQQSIFEKFYRADPHQRAGSGRHRARALHLPRARASHGRLDRRPIPTGRRLDLLLRASGGLTPLRPTRGRRSPRDGAGEVDCIDRSVQTDGQPSCAS